MGIDKHVVTLNERREVQENQREFEEYNVLALVI